MSGATGHGWCTILGRARLEGPLSQLFPWKTTPWAICPKLTAHLSHGRGCLPWKWQVLTTILQGAVQVQVNVPNYVRSHRLKNNVWSIWLKLTKDLPHGRGFLPWRWQVPATIPQGTVQVRVNVLNHVRSHWLKNESWPICSKLTGDLPHGRDCLPWRWQVPATIPWGAVQVWVNVPNHVQQPLAMDAAPFWAGQGWKDPCLNSSPEKLHPGQSAQISQETFPMVGVASPEDGKSLPPFLKEQYKCQ